MSYSQHGGVEDMKPCLGTVLPANPFRPSLGLEFQAAKSTACILRKGRHATVRHFVSRRGVNGRQTVAGMEKGLKVALPRGLHRLNIGGIRDRGDEVDHNLKFPLSLYQSFPVPCRSENHPRMKTNASPLVCNQFKYSPFREVKQGVHQTTASIDRQK